MKNQLLSHPICCQLWSYSSFPWWCLWRSSREDLYWRDVIYFIDSSRAMYCSGMLDALWTVCLKSSWDIYTYVTVSGPGLLISYTGELGYDGLNGTWKIGPSYAKFVVYIWRILDMHRTGTKHIVRHMQKAVVQWAVISKFSCICLWSGILFADRGLGCTKVLDLWFEG